MIIIINWPSRGVDHSLTQQVRELLSGYFSKNSLTRRLGESGSRYGK
jgi:hypothetical protein